MNRMFGLKKVIAIVACLGLSAWAGKVYVNQLGFTPGAAKGAVYVQGEAGAALTLRNVADPETVVLPLEPAEATMWSPSQELASRLDFTSWTQPGSYAIYENGTAISPVFTIASDVYQDLVKASIKWFYYQRASIELKEEHAGQWARPAGHMDTLVQFLNEDGTETKLDLNASKGWYDAGDYGKYIVNSGITMYTLLSLYEHYKNVFNNLEWNIPESGNGFPDLLDEIRWNLDWMLTMQDPADGGVYHKLTTKRFSGSVMPDKDNATRYVVMKTATATYDFAAVMAQAARLYSVLGHHEDAGKFYDAAKAAFAFAEENSGLRFVQPRGMNTGEYGDSNPFDERLWAVVSLALVRQESEYVDMVKTNTRWYTQTPGWNGVGMLATFEAMRYPELFGQPAVAAQDSIKSAASRLLERAKKSSYGVATTSFYWGSNSVVANEGIIMLHAYYLTEEPEYLHAAQAHLDYLLGRNPVDISYVTGFGTRSTMDPHHRPSESDGIVDPVPGMLAGGPHLGGQDIKSSCPDYRVTNAPALSYVDHRCSYATNEVAINWNAPLAYLAGAIHGLANGTANPLKVQPAQAPALSQGPSARLVFQEGAVHLQKTMPDGSVRIFGVTGRRR